MARRQLTLNTPLTDRAGTPLYNLVRFVSWDNDPETQAARAKWCVGRLVGGAFEGLPDRLGWAEKANDAARDVGAQPSGYVNWLAQGTWEAMQDMVYDQCVASGIFGSGVKGGY